MSLPSNLNDREQQKFLDAGIGQTAVRVSLSNNFVPEQYDTIDVTYPTQETEVYVYSLAAVTVATITVTYSDISKANLLSVVRS